VYRRYASLYFIVGVGIEDDENELALLEAIHCLVETLDRYYESVVRTLLHALFFLLWSSGCLVAQLPVLCGSYTGARRRRGGVHAPLECMYARERGAVRRDAR
jgi:hypothetical protein